MKKTYLFVEEQKFRQTWIWVLMIGIVALFIWGNFQQIILGIPFGNHPAPDGFLLVISILLFALMYLLMTVKLETRISAKELRFRFFPLILRARHLPWEEVDTAQVIEYRPLRDYGGWGIRWGARGKAYNVSGRMGLLIKLKTGDEFLIGTQKPEELEEALEKLRTTFHQNI